MPVNAMILCGAANNGALRHSDPAANEALITIAGRPMVQYVIDGLRQSSRVGRIVLVGPPEELRPRVQGTNLEFVPSQDHIIQNIVAAAKVLPPDEGALICSCDIPFISGRIIDGLLDLFAQQDADLYYPIIERPRMDGLFPGTRRTYVHLREGTFTGGNIFLVNPRVVEATAPKAMRFLDYRKNPVKLAGLLGWKFVFRLFMKALTLRELETKVSSLWGVRGAVVICPYPEVGLDVDKPSDLQLARTTLARTDTITG